MSGNAHQRRKRRRAKPLDVSWLLRKIYALGADYLPPAYRR